MPIIEWTEEFSIGNPTLDDQHKKWFSIYNKAHDRMMDPDEKNFISTGIDSLKEMKAYGEYHFSTEEETMAAAGFPELEKHKLMHRAFSRDIDGMIQGLESGNHVLNSEVIKRIENWLRHHILKEDLKFKTFSEQKGRG
ncbi:MAG: bacteriohemerythrin [Desulfobacterales bacterium]|nr:bacteriohemerythrin [Desulfobacterales bacterium]